MGARSIGARAVSVMLPSLVLLGMAGGSLLAAPAASAAESAAAPVARSSYTGIEWRRADADDFDPGLLIGDEEFFDSDSLTSAEIQDFLESRSCRPADGVDCLADYRETTPDVPDVGFGHCKAYAGDAWEAASVIIAGVAHACGINPEVLIVLLQKEQSLITRPSASGYERATGYACPDTADCDQEYFGFFNQVYNAAWQFRQYTLYPTDRQVEVGEDSIAFNPDAACGSALVDVQNQATANLYNYTPYQPDEAAIGNLYGDGGDCSAYGNRNFWRIYTDWFGDPTNDRYPAWLGPCFTDPLARACDGAYWESSPAR
ncbi:hypothetical protein [Naasia lichenicola]|uniref:Hemagglutinin n=1 Tax=Naasia lichenicola TaxID=2565933 RepID=A0A4S4FQ08_9MICO|nr:hypothetical protein [Naasia lichenicola]THG32398.1 hypothetical protein E6C64_05120 [Naasia lichenicola]